MSILQKVAESRNSCATEIWSYTVCITMETILMCYVIIRVFEPVKGYIQLVDRIEKTTK